MRSSPRWLERYRNGQRDLVWHELRQLGAGQLEPEQAAEAQLVSDEMARRARQNVEIIVERLTAEGYRFHVNDDDETPTTPYVPPTDGAMAHADWLVQRFGAVPMTLLSWIRIVGDVWLVGTHPDWPESAAADPLVMTVEGARYPGSNIRNYFDEEWTSHIESDNDNAFVLPLAPDRWHKSNTSGGGPYGMILPDGCVDGLFRAHAEMPFVAYLNWVFRDAGFPWPSGSRQQWRVLHRLREDLLPL